MSNADPSTSGRLKRKALQPSSDGKGSNKSTSQFSSGEMYAASAKNYILRGNAFQLNLLILQFLIAYKNENIKRFSLEKDKVAAGKFDDLFFEYTDKNDKEKSLLLQANHANDPSKESAKIYGTNLLSTSKFNTFSLTKYLDSHVTVKKDPNFPKVKEFVLCTNKSLVLDESLQIKYTKNRRTKNDFIIQFEKVKDVDKNLVSNNYGKQYKIIADDITVSLIKENYKKVYNKSVSSVDVKEFLTSLTFSVNMPHETELFTEIKKKFNGIFQMNNTDVVNSFYVNCSNWYKDRNLKPLTNENAQDFFHKIISKSLLSRIDVATKGFISIIEEHGIKFENVLSEIDDFTQNELNGDKILIVETPKYLLKLGSAAVLQVIEQLNINNDLIFISSKSFNNFFQEFEFRILKETDVKLFVVEVNDRNPLSNSQVQFLLEKCEKVIFILANANDMLCKHVLFNMCIQLGSNLFASLTKASQAKLLESAVKFQFSKELGIGEVKMSEILSVDDFAPIIDNEILGKLINNVEIALGNVIAGLLYDANLYAERKLFPEYVDVNDDGLINKFEYLALNFDKLVKQIKNDDKKVILIHDIAGMGKSTELIHLGLEIKKQLPHFYVLRIELGKQECVDALNYCSKSVPVEFLKYFIKNQFEKDLFVKLFNRGHVVLLLDAFDEIPGDLVFKAIEIIKNLIPGNPNTKNSNNQVILTSRFDCLKDLMKNYEENKKNQVMIFKFKPLTEESQKKLLVRYWSMRCKKTSIETFTKIATEMVKKWNESISEWQSIFLGVPLQARMLAETFEEDISEGFTVNNEMSLIELFDEYFAKKILILAKKKTDGSNLLFKDIDRKINIKESHLALALDLIIKDGLNTDKGFLINVRKNIKNDLTDEEFQTVGLVYIEKGKKVFVHRAFAEFLVGKFLSEKIIDDAKSLKDENEKSLPEYHRIMYEYVLNKIHSSGSNILMFIDEFLRKEKISIEKLIKLFNPAFSVIMEKKLRFDDIYLVGKLPLVFDILWGFLKETVLKFEQLDEPAKEVCIDYFSLVSVNKIVLKSCRNIWKIFLTECEDKFKSFISEHVAKRGHNNVTYIFDFIETKIIFYNGDDSQKTKKALGSLTVDDKLEIVEASYFYYFYRPGEKKEEWSECFYNLCDILVTESSFIDILNKLVEPRFLLYFPIFTNFQKSVGMILTWINKYFKSDTEEIKKWQRNLWIGDEDRNKKNILHNTLANDVLFQCDWILEEKILSTQVFQELIKQKNEQKESIFHTCARNYDKFYFNTEFASRNFNKVFGDKANEELKKLMTCAEESPLKILVDKLTQISLPKDSLINKFCKFAAFLLNIEADIEALNYKTCSFLLIYVEKKKLDSTLKSKLKEKILNLKTKENFELDSKLEQLITYYEECFSVFNSECSESSDDDESCSELQSD